MNRSPAALAGLLIALAAPAAASAATIQVQAACLPNNEILPIVGSGFSPNAGVEVQGLDSSRSYFTDATGSFQGTFLTPNNTTFTPQAVTLTAVDQTNPAVTATAGFQVVKFGSNAPLSGKPGATVTWRFAGFTAGKNIYGHFRFHGKTVRNYKYGKAQGVCGTLKARARRLPAKSRPGTWILQIDQKKSFNANTRPAFKTSFTIFRRFF